MIQPLERLSRRVRRAALVLGVVFGASGLASAVEAATPPKVAVAKVRGSRRTDPAKFAKGLTAGLKAAGAEVVTVPAVKKTKGAFTKGAQEAGADYLIVVKLRYSRGKRFATAQLFDAESGEQLESTRRTFRKKGQAGKTGAAIGESFGKAAVAAFEAKAPAEPETKAPVVVAPPPAPKETKATPSEPASTKAPTASTKKDTGGGFRLGGKEDAVFHVRAGVGTQVGSAYTVAVDGEVTGLAYTLGALFMTQVELSVQSPTLGIGGEVWLSYVPVSFQVDVSPPVEPRDPSGQFFNVGGAVKYRLKLVEFGQTGGLYLTPLLGVGYDSMTVAEQGDNTVVISYSTVQVQGGLRIGAAIDENLVIDVETRLGGALVYDEGPFTTGEGGSGINFKVGGNVRYWFTDIFGAYVGATYAYQRIGLKGLGTRVGFEGDPQLLDATVYNGDFKISSGIQVAL